MATFKNGKIAKYEDNTYSIDTLWDDLEDAFDWHSISGTDNDKVFKVSNKVEIEFLHFLDFDENHFPVIKVNFNGLSYDIYSLNSFYWSPSDRAYRIIIGEAGDIIFKVSSTEYDTGTVHRNSDFMFAIVAVQNTLNDATAGYGVYVPYSCGGVGAAGAMPTPFNHTPRYLITDDTTEDIPNIGRSGGTVSATQTYVINDNAKITALAPICACSSECVSTSSYLMIIGNNYRSGQTELNGELYYSDGGFCLDEGEA